MKRLAVGPDQLQAAALDVLQQLDRGTRRRRQRRADGGLALLRKRKGIRNKGIHRVVSCRGGCGREWKTARLNQRRTACQWMRQTTATVNQR